MKLLTALAASVALLALATPASAHRDRDNNPPGWRGGPGTNWENPRGPRGGPGASPDRRWGYYHWHGRSWRAERWFWRNAYWYWHPYRACWARDRDDNPPGPAGGPGTNWENPPGPHGGPGASPDRNFCR